MNIIESFFGNRTGWPTNKTADVAEIQDGQLYIVRPDTVKGSRECIFNTAVATIQKAEIPNNYRLVITRAYHEGEAELMADDLDDDDAEGGERTFLLDEVLKPKISKSEEGYPVLIWKDFEDDEGDTNFEYMVQRNTPVDHKSFDDFYEAILRALYERKIGEPADTIGRKRLETMFGEAATASKGLGKVELPPNVASADDGSYLAMEMASLNLYDVAQGAYMQPVDGEVEAFLIQTGQYDFWLLVKSQGMNIVAHQLSSDMNFRNSKPLNAFMWNHITKGGKVEAWCLRFATPEEFEAFGSVAARCFYEIQNLTNWEKMKAIEQAYVVDAMEDVEMQDAEADEAVELQESETEEEEDESDIEPTQWDTKKNKKNSALAVGHKGISVVVRGDQIGVFRQTTDNKLELGGTVNGVQAPKAKKGFEPGKVMFHNQDRFLVLMNPKKRNMLYNMDLEMGKVVDEWRVKDDIEVNAITPMNKFAQRTTQESIIGASHNALFVIDPRLSGDKLARDHMKQYTTKNKFSSLATTECGYIAVGSEKGDIRLFDTVGKIAKTSLPSLGDPIRGLDVTKDGRYVVATCKTYLLLVDTKIGNGKWAGHSGFQKSFPADSKPMPRRLQLRPEHVAYMGEAVNFSPAKFNADPDRPETAIVTSSGPFVIAWNFREVKKGKLHSYQIKKYGDNVVEDNFTFTRDPKTEEIIVALQDDVFMVPKTALKTADRKSLGGLSAQARPSHSDVVHQPF